MQVIINTRGLSISKTYRDEVTRRLQKLEGLLPKIMETKVVLSKEKHRRTAALTLIAKHRTFRSEETAGALAAALDMAADALTRQVREAKDRVKNRKGQGARRVIEVSAPAPPSEPEVIVRRVPLKPMSLGEAVDEFRLGSDEFLVFANARTDAVNVLYRRRDGGLGLVEPVA